MENSLLNWHYRAQNSYFDKLVVERSRNISNHPTAEARWPSFVFFVNRIIREKVSLKLLPGN